MRRLVLLFFFLIGFISIFAQLQAQYGCKRIIQTEKILCKPDKNKICLHNEMGTLSGEMGFTFENLITKINYILGLQLATIALLLVLLGYMIWDRRTALNPVRDDVVKLKSENEKMKSVFRFLSETQPQLREMLKNAGIL